MIFNKTQTLVSENLQKSKSMKKIKNYLFDDNRLFDAGVSNLVNVLTVGRISLK
jgi:hypothetical protein